MTLRTTHKMDDLTTPMESRISNIWFLEVCKESISQGYYDNGTYKFYRTFLVTHTGAAHVRHYSTIQTEYELKKEDKRYNGRASLMNIIVDPSEIPINIMILWVNVIKEAAGL